MKKYLLIAIGLLVIGPAHSQLLSTNPYFPLDTSSVVITVDCSKGNQGLLNYANTNDVYVHVGVITNLSTSSSDWRYVKFTWGTVTAAAQAVSLGNNKYRYSINNIRSFFGVPAGETILKMAILFRSGNGSIKQANADGSDMYVNIYTYSLATQFLLPPFQPKYAPIPEPVTKIIGDTLPVNYVVNKTATLQLFFNGTLMDSVPNNTSLKYTLQIVASGNQQIIATAYDGTTTKSDTLNFFVGGATNIAPLPPGAKEGINYLGGDTSVLLVLFAPHKNKIVVLGDFNNWVQQTSYQMNETPDSNYFWIQINGLAAGTEYAYQYVIDDSIIVADYNTEKVLDKNVDPAISSTTYPNLKSFPSNASGSLVSIIQTAKPAYNWQATNFQRPEKSKLVIYELLLRDFLAQGNWQTLMDTLNYLKRLGVNAIEVMPFNNFEGASSWGYNPNFYFTPDKVYGTETALKQFIDACHQDGMAVIMDMVLNHSFGSSPMVQMYWDSRSNIPAANNPWFNQYATHAYNVGYQFNHESAATKAFTQRVIAYWLNNYHIDGYRFDLAKGFTQNRTCDAFGNNCNVAAWGAYDASRVAIWDTIYNQLQAISPNSYCILEMFADNSEETVEANYGMILWGNMNYNFNQATMGYTDGWDLSGSIYTTLGWNHPNQVVYQESHDEERLMYKNEQYGNSSGSYNIKDIPTGLKRNEMGAAFWALAPGPKMLWQFGELGYDYSINTCVNGTVDGSGSCRLDPKPVKWDYLQDANRRNLHDVYASLLNLRIKYPDLAVATPTFSLNNAFKTLQVSGSGISVAVIGNFDVVSSTGSITFPTAGTWYNYLGTDSISATGSSQNITLNAGDYKVFINKNLNDTNHVLPPDTTSVNGIKIYPNPVISSNSVIKYSLPVASNVSLSVYNITGQLVKSFSLGNQASGTHSFTFSDVSFNIQALRNGIYVMKLNSDRQTAHIAFSVLH
jgi:1,4-alpha-glucan branching enzyme